MCTKHTVLLNLASPSPTKVTFPFPSAGMWSLADSLTVSQPIIRHINFSIKFTGLSLVSF